MNPKPLEGILVIDFSHLLSGPSASLRLADLGARVIKIEHPERGDLCREIYVSNCDIDGESSLFQAINRNKDSICLDLKRNEDIQAILDLVKKADVVISNFRPGVMQRLGLDYETLKSVNSRIIYGEISGYGETGPFANAVGQDLLVQSVSGLTWMSGNGDTGPVPMGIAVADIFAGSQLCQGILAALFRQQLDGEGARISVSMLESMLDFQFEPLTIHYQAPNQPILRSKTHNAHPLVGGAYGVYKTHDGYITISMGSILKIGELIGCEGLMQFDDPEQWFNRRDEIKRILAEHLVSHTTAYWLSLLEPADIWCSDVLDLERLIEHPGFKTLNMLQNIVLKNGNSYVTTRCPIRIDGKLVFADKAPPLKGEHTQAVFDEFQLEKE